MADGRGADRTTSSRSRSRVPSEFDFTARPVSSTCTSPATDARRSFSMANLPGDGDAIELMIKRYPGGRLSGHARHRDRRRAPRSASPGPYGALRLRDAEPADPDDRRRLGDGADPVAAAPLAARGMRAPGAVLLRRATARDLFQLDEIARSAALSRLLGSAGRGRFVHEAVDDVARRRRIDVYMCGPPPMLEAAEAMLIGSTASTGSGSSPTSSRPRPTPSRRRRGGRRRAAPARRSEREFAWFDAGRAARDAVRGRHDRHPALGPPPPRRAGGR